MSLTDSERSTVLESVELGMPLDRVAPLVNTTVRHLRAEMKADRKFGAAVKAAESRCMKHCLEVLKTSKQWQANTFVLESRWPGQFRRNRKLPDPVAQTPLPLNDERLGRLNLADFVLLEYLWNKMNGRPTIVDVPDPPRRENGQGPPISG